MDIEPSANPARETYRHGDLHRVLVDAGLALARVGGPDAVVLREATRRAGVVPNAAYRHFANRQALLQAVRAAALSALSVAIETEIAALDPAAPPVERARGLLRAVGMAYVQFAVDETGLFRTAFVASEPGLAAPGPSKAGRSGLDPFQLLGMALNAMVAAGLLAPDHRPDAEYLAWSSVHGLATLVTDGPLRDMPAAKRRAIGERLVAMVEAGL
jgi:AcrR family transcriptional regulator